MVHSVGGVGVLDGRGWSCVWCSNMLQQSSIGVIIRNTRLSSAKCLVVTLEVDNEISFVYNRKRIGPITVPWGTPEEMGTEWEEEPLRRTCYSLLERKAVDQWRVLVLWFCNTIISVLFLVRKFAIGFNEVNNNRVNLFNIASAKKCDELRFAWPIMLETVLRVSEGVVGVCTIQNVFRNFTREWDGAVDIGVSPVASLEYRVNVWVNPVMRKISSGDILWKRK